MQRASARSVATSRTSVVIGTAEDNPLNALHKQYAPLAHMMPWEILDYVELLATYNPDYSQAVDNIRTLANSGHELFVDGSKRTAKRVKTSLEEKARDIQKAHGGIDGLIDKLLRQGAVFGAMAGEWILNEELTEVVDFVDVSPKSIRFFWEDNHWAPYQKVTAAQAQEAEKNGQKVENQCVKLNETTFSYYAFDAAPGSPYGVPPFVAALTNIAIQKDMVTNMSQIVKKVGMLGIIDLAIKQLPRKPSESPEQYEARAKGYLDSYVDVLEDMVAEGGLAHFDDVEVNTYSITGNAAGATNIFKQNEELIFSGLKSMPSVQGRSYSSTETYAGVAYDIIIRNTLKYQRSCKRMIEQGYWLMCTLAADMPDGIRLQFNSNKTLQRLQVAQAETIEIRNAAMLWLSGLIDQIGYAQRLGYSDPKKVMEDPPPELLGAARKNLPSGDDNERESDNDRKDDDDDEEEDEEE